VLDVTPVLQATVERPWLLSQMDETEQKSLACLIAEGWVKNYDPEQNMSMT
jgi:hypothetical protein